MTREPVFPSTMPVRDVARLAVNLAHHYSRELGVEYTPGLMWHDGGWRAAATRTSWLADASPNFHVIGVITRVARNGKSYWDIHPEWRAPSIPAPSRKGGGEK